LSKFKSIGADVRCIDRNGQDLRWDNHTEIIKALNGSDLLINLAGKSVDCRYTESNKRLILESRINATNTLGHLISQCKLPPKVWMNASSATIYRHAEDRFMDEKDGEIGTGFSVGVVKEWEKAFFSYSDKGSRMIALRMSIIMGEGGVYPILKRLVKFGFGGKMGKGTQKFSFMHIEDLYRAILFLYSNPNSEGSYNCSSPEAVSNEVLMKTLRKKVGIGFGLPLSEWMLKFGAVVIGTETELILKSRWVMPARLLSEGFQCQFPKIEQCT
ncbi:MAG TPA: TIGR01777 family oxidoreductase, partial [Bacteroidia bacterium]